MHSPTAAALAASVDDLLHVGPSGPARDGVPDAARTIVLVDGAAPVARVVLALDERDLAGADLAAGDALLVHRHWQVPLDRLPADVAVLACHEPLDLALGLASTPALHRALGLREVETVGERDRRPLAAVCEPVGPLTLGALRARLRATFGDVEAEEATHDDAADVARVVTARAMTPALVRAAAAAGAVAYVTGQIRAPARAVARACCVHVLAIGHRRSERWALHVLASLLRARWPSLAVDVVDEGMPPAARHHQPASAPPAARPA